MAVFGDQNSESGSDTWGVNEINIYGRFQAVDGNGTLDSITIAWVGGSQNTTVTYVIYDDSSSEPNNLVAYFPSVTIALGSDGWVTASTGMSGAGAITNNAFYWLGFLITAQPGTPAANRHLLAGGAQQRHKASVGGTPPDPWPVADDTPGTALGSTYATYTPGVGGLTGSSTLVEVVGITSTGIPTRKGASVIAEVFGATSSGHSVQAALVFADSVDGSWTDQGGGTNLTAAIDEATANTSDYIRSELTPQDSGCRVKLATIGVPSSTSNHFVRWSIAKDVASGDTINMTVKLYQGGGNSQGAGTLIASFARNNVSETFTTYSETLSAGEVASISDYTDLYLEFFADTA